MFWLAQQLFGVVLVLVGAYCAIIWTMDLLAWLLLSKPKNDQND